MNNTIKNKYREEMVAKLLAFCSGKDNENDCGLIASNKFNMPFVTDDGEEGWFEVTVSVPNDAGDDGYLKRDAYALHLTEKAQKEAEAKAKKEAKIAKDKARREELKRKAKSE